MAIADDLVDDLVLMGSVAALEPLSRDHREGLLRAASDGNLWELWFTSVPSEKTIDKYLDSALDQKAKGLAMPFSVIHNETGKIIGSSRYCNIDNANQRLEIGYTWYSSAFQRTSVNTECKLLLLTYAFEKLNAIAVEFRTNYHNHRSRSAILRLGAKQDGILRNHKIGENGILRDTVIFSILNTEWPGVKESLTFNLAKK